VLAERSVARLQILGPESLIEGSLESLTGHGDEGLAGTGIAEQLVGERVDDEGPLHLIF
jgi:hypothetical protein